jgi:hypothetical protein
MSIRWAKYVRVFIVLFSFCFPRLPKGLCRGPGVDVVSDPNVGHSDCERKFFDHVHRRLSEIEKLPPLRFRNIFEASPVYDDLVAEMLDALKSMIAATFLKVALRFA